MSPSVSICIPTYNMAKYVGLAVQSVLNQTHTDFELVVCDNASTDNTPEILAQFNDPRLKVYRNAQNMGAIRNFNLAIERASGDWVKFLEADDVLEPTCLAKCMAMVSRDPEVDVVSVGRTRIWADGSPFLREVHRRTEIVTGATVRQRVHLRHNEFGTPTDVMARKSLLISIGGFDPDYGSYLNDWDLWLRCQEKARKVAFVAEALVQVRSHAGQIGSAGAKANIDIDVVHKMLCKRWACVRPFSAMWWQHKYFKIVLSASYFYRGVRQAMRGDMAPGVSRWDAFTRLWHYLRCPAFMFVALFTLFYMPLYPWYARHLTNAQSVSAAGQIVQPPVNARLEFALLVVALYAGLAVVLGGYFVRWLVHLF